MSAPECITCGGTYPARRRALGYTTCLDCGDAEAVRARASWTVCPAGHKQGYTLLTKKDQLKEINKYAQT